MTGGDAKCHTQEQGTHHQDCSPAPAVQPSGAGDHLAPDAPILHLLSLRENPNVATMSEDELRSLVQRLRTVAQSPQTLTAELQKESNRVNPRQRNSQAAKRKAILADI